MIDDHAILTIPRGVRMHEDRVRGNWVLLAPERALTLDPVGRAILSEIDATRTFGEITAHLANSFGAPVDQVRADSAEFVGYLLDRRILEVRP